MLPDDQSDVCQNKTKIFVIFQLFRILNEAWSTFSSPHLVNCTMAHALIMGNFNSRSQPDEKFHMKAI